MFWRKKTPAEAESAAAPAAKSRLGRFFHYLGRAVKYCCFFLLFILICAFGALFWLTQTQSGQAWILKTANAALAPAPGADGLSFQLTSIAGSIPASFSFGLEISDRHGVWLAAPDNVLIWNWRALPGEIHISKISANSVDMSRLPDTPPAPPAPPSPPMTMADAQRLLAQAADFLAQKHWWLPQIRVDEISAPAVLLPPSLLPAPQNAPQRLKLAAQASLAMIDNKADAKVEAGLTNALAKSLAAPAIEFDALTATLALKAGPISKGLQAAVTAQAAINAPKLHAANLPPDFLGDRTELDLALDAKATAYGPGEGLAIRLAGPKLSAGKITVTGDGGWQTDNSWSSGELAGPLAYRLNASLQPLEADSASPLAALRAPLAAVLDINGQLPRLNLLLDIDCADIEQNGHAITDAKITLAAKDVELPVNAVDIHALERENHLDLNAQATVDRHRGNVATEIFFQALTQKEPGDAAGWRAGFRNLAIAALGVRGSGNVAVLLPEGQKPGIDGQISLKVTDWKDISAFLPGQTLAGDVSLNAALASGIGVSDAQAVSLPGNRSASQRADVKISIPAFSMRSKDSTVELAGFEAAASLADLFNAPAVNASVEARRIAAAGMELACAIRANGPFSGPLKAEISSKGSVNAKVAAEWQPGRLRLDKLEAVADLSRFIKMEKGKKMLAGLRAAQSAELLYGDGGIEARHLDLRLLPSGSLTANGGLAPDKLNLNMELKDFQLKPLQAIAGAIPSGVVGLTAKIQGTPQKPAGGFRLSLRDIAMPQSPLAPMSLAVSGALEHGRQSALKVRVDLDPKTVKTLGGETAAITARLPLVFGPDGVPRPDMGGPLAAAVRWDGALGPIWNLLPLADQRLNGRVNIDLKAGGSLKTPKITGSAGVSQARYENLLFGVLLTDINANVSLLDGGKGPLPGGMKLNLSLSDGLGGSVTVSGQGALNGDNLNVKAKINKLKPLRRRDVHIELSGHAEVAGDAAAPKITGEIIVDKGEILLDNLDIASSVTTLPITDPAHEKAAAKPETQKTAAKAQKAGASAQTAGSAPVAPDPGGALNVKITMLPRFHVEGRGLASVWKADLLVHGALTDPKISGNISCVRGNFDFLGKNFALTKGVVFFGGGSLANPLVDIDLTNETPDLTAHILVTGPVSKIKLQLTSDPSVPRDEILSRVLFGRSVNDLSRAEALQLAGAVAQLAGFGGGGGLLGSAKKALGVDVLRIGTSDTGDEGDNNAGGTNVEMGKYINDYIYMGVQQGLKPDSTAFIIEIEISPRSHLELRTEQNNTWGGFKWKYNY